MQLTKRLAGCLVDPRQPGKVQHSTPALVRQRLGDPVCRTELERERRVIIKAEVARHPRRNPKNDPRFVVTNLPAAPRCPRRG